MRRFLVPEANTILTTVAATKSTAAKATATNVARAIAPMIGKASMNVPPMVPSYPGSFSISALVNPFVLSKKILL